jgi:hypothetical protein
MSRPSTAQSSSSSRPPQSMAPQSMAPQLMADPRLRPDPRSMVASQPQQKQFDPSKAAASVAASPQNRVYRPIDEKTKSIQPSSEVLRDACRISLREDKPIILTFWHDSILRNVFLSTNPKEKETIIEKVKESPNDEGEYTSRIIHDHRNGIFETENSIYIVVPDIQRA